MMELRNGRRNDFYLFSLRHFIILLNVSLHQHINMDFCIFLIAYEDKIKYEKFIRFL